MNKNSKYNHQQDFADVFLSRRDLLSRMGNGFAGMSLASILAQEANAQEARKAVKKLQPAPSPQRSGNPLIAKAPPLPAKAKRVTPTVGH